MKVIRETALNEYQKIVWGSYFGKDMDKPNQLINNALKLTGEAGEVVDQIGKELYLGASFSREEILEELGDLFWHLSCMASVRGVTLQEVADYNIKKLRERYPNANWPKEE